MDSLLEERSNQRQPISPGNYNTLGVDTPPTPNYQEQKIEQPTPQEQQQQYTQKQQPKTIPIRTAVNEVYVRQEKHRINLIVGIATGLVSGIATYLFGMLGFGVSLVGIGYLMFQIKGVVQELKDFNQKYGQTSNQRF